jgi:hypothetical protein
VDASSASVITSRRINRAAPSRSTLAAIAAGPSPRRCGLTTETAQVTPHRVHFHALTRDVVRVSATPSVPPHPGHPWACWYRFTGCTHGFGSRGNRRSLCGGAPHAPATHHVAAQRAVRRVPDPVRNRLACAHEQPPRSPRAGRGAGWNPAGRQELEAGRCTRLAASQEFAGEPRRWNREDHRAHSVQHH